MADPIQRLRTRLEAEQTALLSGNIQELVRMSKDRETLTVPPDASRADLAGLGQLAARNALLLKAAMAGVSAARDRIFRDARASLETYSADGQRLKVCRAPPNVERRR